MSNQLITLVVVTRERNNVDTAMSRIINHIVESHNNIGLDFIAVSDGNTAANDQFAVVAGLKQAAELCATPWLMFCDEETRLVDGVLPRLVARADEAEARMVIGGIEKPDAGIFTLQGKLMRPELLREIALATHDVTGNAYETVQHIMRVAGKVTGYAPQVIARADLSRVNATLTGAHRELLFHMATLYVEFQLCDRCNLNCAYCSHMSPISAPVIMSIETLEQECNRIARWGVNEVNLMGGEPLMHPQLVEAITVTRRILPNVKLTVTTNGLLLGRMKRDFWEACRNNNVVIRITCYPKESVRKYLKGVWLVLSHHVKLERAGWRFGFRHQLLDERGSFNAAANYQQCQLHCTQVRDATLWPCAYAAYAFNLNRRFGTGFKTADGDSLPMTDALTADDVRLWVFTAKPFCRYCAISQARRVAWKRSACARDEWVKGADN